MGVGVTVVVAVWLLALSSYDVRERRLPNWLTLPGAVLIT
ncbi:prepilin peptidase [Mycolicibacterium peregrinum]|nr:prepilin peptidase [Mycolicibacterium peregrinum]